MIKQTFSLNNSTLKSLNQFDSQCVCQICTCHKHKCPHSKINIPFEEISSYQKQYVPHPIKNTTKFCTDNLKYQYKPYDYINSSYRQNYPGHKPQMRQKIVPRVKNQDRNIPLQGESWYKSTYQPKSVTKDKLRNKDKQYNPCQQPFYATTTYKSSFFPKRPHSQMKNSPQQINYPQGYRFNQNTTYSNDFIPKNVNSVPSFKPVQKVAPKGKHFLNSTYRDDYQGKRPIDTCPVLSLPKYPQTVSYPSEHVCFNKTREVWQEK